MNRRYFRCAALLLVAAAAAFGAVRKAGIEAWQRADYAGAVAIWRPLAEKGDADAAFNLGQAYRLGRGVTTNLGAAQTWFERAAQQGPCRRPDDARPAAVPERRPGRGPEMAQGRRRARRTSALLVYGTALFNGDSVTQDPVLGYAYVSRAAAQGLAPAKETLGAARQAPAARQTARRAWRSRMAKAKTAPPPARKAGESRGPSRRRSPSAKPQPKPSRSRAPLRQARQVARDRRGKGAGASSLALSRSAARPKRSTRSCRASRACRPAALLCRRSGAVTRLQVGPFASNARAQPARLHRRLAATGLFPGRRRK